MKEKGVRNVVLEKSNVWINRSRSNPENGFIIQVEDKTYVGSIRNLERFIKGEIDGVRLSKVIQE